jgi:hypothetical protein
MQEPPDFDIEALAEQIRLGQDEIQLPDDLLRELGLDTAQARNMFALIQQMSIGERLKLALKGGRDARAILIRDSNRLVQRFVMQNPRLTEDEVLAMCRNRNIDSDVLRIVGDNREWTKSYQVRMGLASNAKTPLAIALSFVQGLVEKDIRLLAKSRNVSSAVASKARRILVERDKRQR